MTTVEHQIKTSIVTYTVAHRCYKFESGETDRIIFDTEDINKVENWYMNYIWEEDLPRWRMQEADYFELLIVDDEREKELIQKQWCKYEGNTDESTGKFLMPLYEHINRWNWEIPDVAYSTAF